MFNRVLLGTAVTAAGVAVGDGSVRVVREAVKSPKKKQKKAPAKQVLDGNYVYDREDYNRQGIWSKSNLYASESDFDTAFHMGVQRCATAFFPGARMPLMNQVVEKEVDDSFDWGKIAPAPGRAASKITKKKALGCFKGNIYRKGDSRNFLARSEFAIRRGKFGMVLWTGVRGNYQEVNLDGEKQEQYRVYVGYRMAFYSFEKRRWNIKSAFSWDGTARDGSSIGASGVSFTFPDGNTISPMAIEDHGLDHGYGGLWFEGRGDSVGLTVNLNPYVETAHPVDPQTKKVGMIAAHTRSVKGLLGSARTAFYEETPGSGDWKWVRFKRDGKLQHALTSSMWPRWTDLFVDRKGQWVSLNDHCPTMFGTHQPNKPASAICYKKA